ncbi:MAG: tRNA epoxyqueuosine(34) reductase QueG, partial [Alistipes sp.]|nr:tRNA epoxyqueuosine(34) reductase QueG [Alistipes sp.]
MLERATLKKLAAEAGFDLCGVAPCRHLDEGERRFRRWLEQGCQASLGYMERHTDKRFDPRRL